MLPIVRFAVLYLLATSVGFSLMVVFARQAGYSLIQLCMFNGLVYLFPVCVIPFVRQLPTRRSFTLALGAAAIGIVCLAMLHRHLLVYWAIAPCIGVTMVCFWIVYLTRQVSEGPEKAHAFNSSLIVAIQFGTACISPLVAGQLGERWGTVGVMLGSASIMLLALTQIRAVRPGDVQVRVRAVWREISGHARLLLLFQGMIEALLFGMLALVTTTYLDSPMRFGMFFSFVAFVGSTGNLLISRWSDRVGNRSRMVYVGCGLMAFASIGLATASTLLQWSLFAGAFQVGFTLTLPYFMAITLDASPTAADAFAVREWVCNIGRMMTVAVGLTLLLTTGHIQHVYFWGLVPLAVYLGIMRHGIAHAKLSV